MKKLVAILLCSLMATQAFALLDEDADMMGVYLDMAGDVVCGPNMGIVTMYLLYTNPTLAGVRGFECEVQLLQAGMPAAGMWFPATFPIPATRLGDAGMFSVGYSAVLGTSPATLLATLQFYSMNPAVAIDVFLKEAVPNSGTLPLPAVLDPAYQVMHVGLSAAEGPVAQIGALQCAVVDTEDASFGAVKALFR